MNSIDKFFWEGYWHLLCHRSEVCKPRDFVRLKGFGQEIVAFHDGKDIVVFDNRCPHRGAMIFGDDSGNQPFLCPYHNWSYSKGRVFIADPKQFAHCDKPKPDLNRYQTAWVGDFLFFAIKPLKSVEEQLGEVGPMVHSISTSVEARHDFASYKYDSIWQISIENALEPYHVSAIHPDSLAKLRLTSGRNEFFESNSVWYTEVGDSRTVKQLANLLKFFTIDYLYEGYFNLHLFPFSMISSTFGISYSVQNFFPATENGITAFASRLYRSRLADQSKENIVAHLMNSTAKLNRQVFMEDKMICQRIPASSWTMSAPEYYALPDEERLFYFRERLRSEISVIE
jgi:phenylpropionate dioxygenase-like ring-hydroxylating dioxygenase large terminal subunit